MFISSYMKRQIIKDIIDFFPELTSKIKDIAEKAQLVSKGPSIDIDEINRIFGGLLKIEEAVGDIGGGLDSAVEVEDVGGEKDRCVVITLKPFKEIIEQERMIRRRFIIGNGFSYGVMERTGSAK